MLNYKTDKRVQLLSDETKHEMLQLFTQWADSDEGRDYRAGLAHGGLESVITARDVVAVCSEEALSEIVSVFGELA